ncbi:MAG: long-chain fatty acid--CoA ligase [SAR324 cluster bacterium]|nr:long-chain fatty acid--CoA ligase [SAR324 cluster bacterium]
MKDSDKTIAQIFKARVEEKGDAPLFIYSKGTDFPPFTVAGKTRTMSWNEVSEQVRNIGMGLLALGAHKGDRISIMSMTRPEWVIADLALLSIGGETVSIYPNLLPEQALYIVNDLESRFLFVEGVERRDGLLAIIDQSPQVEKIITLGCDAGDNPLCMDFDDLLELGKSNASTYASIYEDNLAAGKLSDVATYIYTSGTTGVPKGAVHNHGSITYTICTGATWMPIEPGWIDLVFLPMAHVFEQFAGSFLDIYRGDVKIAFARDMTTIAEDFSLVKPHYCRSTPRLFEKIYSTIWTKIEPLADLTTESFTKALEISRRVVVEGGLYGKPALDDEIKKHQQYEENNYQKIRNLALGGNIKFFVAGGAPFSKAINEFYWSIGLPIYELYGMTETGGATTNRPGEIKLGTVGKSWPCGEWPGGGGETDLSPDGEIIMKGPNVMLRYHNKPEATAETTRDGWLYSGDIGEKDAEGYIKVTDRIKDIIITSGGKNVAPVGIEATIKEAPLISQAVVFGDRKKYLTALITLDPDGLEEESRSLKLTGDYRTLTQAPEIRKQVEQIINEKNKKLAKFETIKDFVIIDEDLTPENGLVGPTMKVKRKAVVKRYAEKLDALYDD